MLRYHSNGHTHVLQGPTLLIRKGSAGSELHQVF